MGLCVTVSTSGSFFPQIPSECLGESSLVLVILSHHLFCSMITKSLSYILWEIPIRNGPALDSPVSSADNTDTKNLFKFSETGVSKNYFYTTIIGSTNSVRQVGPEALEIRLITSDSLHIFSNLL